MKSGHITQYTHLSQFTSLKAFNNSIEQWMIDVKGKFTKSELIGLKRLIRYSAKIPGVCNAKIQTLVSACAEMGGISRRTFERMLTKAKSFGLLKVENTYKENGKQGHNIYIFNIYTSQSNDVPQQENIVAPKETTSPSKTNNIKDLKERTITLDSTFTANKVPKTFTELAGYFFNDPKTIEELYLVVKQVTKYYFHYNDSDKAELACESLKQLVRNMKLGKRRIDNVFGYYNRIVHGILDKRFEEFMSGDRSA